MSKPITKYAPDRDAFCVKDFKTPPESCVPVYAWIWNGVVSEEETDRQLEEMKRMGIRSFYIIPEPKTFRPTVMPTMMEPDYLTPAYFKAYRYAVCKAGEFGMTAWLYDEGGWPSGGASGRVLYKRPDMARCTMETRVKTCVAGETYHKPDTVAAAFWNEKQISDGYVCQEDTEITEYYSKPHLFEYPGGMDYPDITRKEAAETFIEITHESYKAYMKDLFGESIRAVFTDEPTGPRPFPFQDEIISEFEAKYGYTIYPFLPVLAGKVPINDSNRQAVLDWYNLCSELYCRNFLLAQKKWSNENGMLFTGHLAGDDTPDGFLAACNYHLMRALRCMDMPGVDAIWRQIFPIEEQVMGGVKVGENKFFPRYASSAATQVGSRHSMTESNGVYGQGMTFDEMRYVYTFQAIRGINVYNLFAIPYAREIFLMGGEMPSMVEASACYADMPIFNRYLERLSYLTSLGKRAATIALYYPVNDFWTGEYRKECSDAFEKAGYELERSQLYFDVLDDDVLAGADLEALENGQICMGEACYTVVVVPPCRQMPAKSIEVLEKFVQGGGKVYTVQKEDMPVIRGTIEVQNCIQLMPSVLFFRGEKEGIRFQERTLENGKLYLVSNESFDKVTVDITVPEATNIYILNPTDGTIMDLADDKESINMTLESGELQAILCTEVRYETEHENRNNRKRTETTASQKMETVEMQLDGPYTFRKISQFQIGERTYQKVALSEAPTNITLGDWRTTVGEEFSGSAIYSTTFRKPEAAGNLVLELGTVKYTCEVFLNGQSLGVLVMPPYRYVLSQEWMKEENLLEIRVSNTGANEYLATDAFDIWQPWQMGTYWEREKAFMPDSVPSGLYGPVRITYNSKEQRKDCGTGIGHDSCMEQNGEKKMR